MLGIFAQLLLTNNKKNYAAAVPQKWYKNAIYAIDVVERPTKQALSKAKENRP